MRAVIHSYKHKDLITREKERNGVFKLLPRILFKKRKQASKTNFLRSFYEKEAKRQRERRYR